MQKIAKIAKTRFSCQNDRNMKIELLFNYVLDKQLDFATVCNITTKNRTSSFLDFREALGKHLIIVMREEGGLLIPS